MTSGAGEDWNGLPVTPEPLTTGYFTVNKIDANGDCHVGCHHLDFVLMEQLAVKVVPYLVKARYPVPSLQFANFTERAVLARHIIEDVIREEAM